MNGCKVCGKKRPIVAKRHGDPYCSTVCCRKDHGMVDSSAKKTWVTEKSEPMFLSTQAVATRRYRKKYGEKIKVRHRNEQRAKAKSIRRLGIVIPGSTPFNGRPPRRQYKSRVGTGNEGRHAPHHGTTGKW